MHEADERLVAGVGLRAELLTNIWFLNCKFACSEASSPQNHAPILEMAVNNRFSFAATKYDFMSWNILPKNDFESSMQFVL
jgi:hypothetical protein